MEEQTELFKLTRASLAQQIAAHISGTKDAIPEKEDFRIANLMLGVLKTEIDKF